MAAQQIFVLFVLILVHNVENEGPFGIAFKCCGVYELFDSSGECVPAPWPPADVDIGLDQWSAVGASDESWTSRWFPPGPPRRELVGERGVIRHSALASPEMKMYLLLMHFARAYSLRVTVNQSAFYRDMKDVRDWGNYMVYRDNYLVRRVQGKELRDPHYCVDAVKGPMTSYVLVIINSRDEENDVFAKCCKFGEVVVNKRAGKLDCETDRRAWTHLTNMSFSSQFNLETSFFAVSTLIRAADAFKVINQNFHTSALPPNDVQYTRLVQYTRHSIVNFLFSTWIFPCADLKRDKNGHVTEVLGYFVVCRLTRASYLISRNLSVVSALVLLAALVVIGCKERMRSSAHGWALGCHILCLMLFNIGHIAFTETMSAEIEDYEPITTEEKLSCLGFAIPMSFLLTGASAWMTAVSANMFYGFKVTGGVRAGVGDRKRFLKMSAFAWGVATALTGTSVATFLSIDDTVEQPGEHVRILPWYRPTFAETRTCFIEIGNFTTRNLLQYRSQKWGTTLYYYVPTLVLVAASCVFLWLTGRKVRYLRRGNSVLRRDEEGRGRTKGKRGQQDKESAAEPKSATVYIKLLLTGGVFEFLAEFITWAVSRYHPWTNHPSKNFTTRLKEMAAEARSFEYADHTYAHRTVGYWADLFRALVVLLVLVVAPDLRAVWRRLRGKGGDSPAQGAATRPAPRPAARPAPRRGQQESAL